jgi:spermidine synthase
VHRQIGEAALKEQNEEQQQTQSQAQEQKPNAEDKKTFAGAKYFIAAAVASLCGMSIEMVASRVIAPFFGTSQFVWGVLIGIILLSMSIGSYLGGNLADKVKDFDKAIANILSWSGLAIVVIGLLKNILLATLSSLGIGAVIFSALILFGPVSVLLPMVTPLIIKSVQSRGGELGKNVGRISAVATCGSVIGVFATSFLLLPLIGNAWAIVALAIIVSVTALLFRWKSYLQIIAVVCSFVVMAYPISTAAIFQDTVEIDTMYGNYLIIDDGEVVMIYVAGGIESQKKHGSNELLSRYTQYYDLAFHYKDDITQALCLGGAGYVYPQYFVEQYPSASIDVVEIDPAMEDIARQYFGLQTGERLSSIIRDARSYLNHNEKTYDVIYGDAFKGNTPPYECLTYEATQEIHEALTDDGVYIANIISSRVARNSRLFQSYYNTLSAVFPNVDCFWATKDYRAPDETGNIILVATKGDPISDVSANPYLQDMLDTRLSTPETFDIPILTDDRAPVELYTFFY